MSTDSLSSLPTTAGGATVTLRQTGVVMWLYVGNAVLLIGLVLLTIAGSPAALQSAILATGALITALLLRLAAVRTSEPRMRASWNWLAVMVLCLGGYSAFVSVTGERMVTSFGDFGNVSRYFNVAGYASCFVALWFCVSVPKRLLARLFLDTGIVLAGVIVILRLTLHHSSLQVTGSDLTNPLIYIWLVDLAALCLALLSLASLPRGTRLPTQLVYISVALAIMCAGHAGAATASLQMASARPGWVYVCFGLSGWTLSLMAYRFIRGTRTGVVYQTVELSAPSPLSQSVWFHLGHAILPYSIAMGAAALLFTQATGGADGLNRNAALAGAACFVAVAGLRHVISYSENRALYVNLTELNRGLEDLVDERTTELSRRNHELEAIYQVAVVSAASLDLTRILQAVAEQLTQAVDASRCVILERTDGDTTLRPVAVFPPPGPVTVTPDDAQDSSLVGLPGTLREPAGSRSSLVERRWLDSDSAAARLMDEYAAGSAMLVPLVAGERTIGVAELYRARTEPFTEHEVSLAEAITTQGALAAENANAYDRARFAANHDPVTGLLNHRALHEELTRLFERAMLRDTRLTVLMMDLNLFKEFNDRYGHQAGDRVLADIGQAIKQSLPASAIVARYGGDEFTVGVPDTPPETAEMFVAAIRERAGLVQEKHGYVGEGFGVSIGVASYPDDGVSLADIVARADEAMYEDKWRLKGFLERRREHPARVMALESPVL